jgi:CMP-N-acetylneuraminic acid synthetase
MKAVGFMPFWMGYHPQTGSQLNRALRKLGGRYLINYSLQLLNRCELLSDTLVFASDDSIGDYIEDDIAYRFCQRPAFLDDDDISIEDIITEFLNHTDADVIALVHPNSPFLRLETLNDCLEQVMSGEYDSAFTAYKFQKFSWFQGKPLNYSLSEPTPKLRDIEPLILEQSSLYVFTREIFLKQLKRVGGESFIRFVDHFEGHDVGENEDFEMAELIINSGMFTEISR